MTIKQKKSDAVKFLEKLTGGPLTLGETLWSIRRCEEWSQTEFAKKLGVTTSHICDIEKGRKVVSPERAARFAKRLGYSEAQFVRLALQDMLKQSGLSYSVRLEAA